ncbi:MAG TPA: efflux transporter outer membrane subunit [Phenylobacterium sp.]|uniref:efflux transporter outer membrane subunit n=1 Tax=Phenylobacterium sp. TaxID=1871053 RepID=UPI002B45F0A9|nr:efflux transporter outer membrane subunit [Phenylobacterium sp.]HKR90470.1 efflux transporter outer membrane subunit [Phenylobacterium sp.]
MHKFILPLAAAGALSACAAVPRLGPEPQAKPAQSYAAAQSFQAPQAPWPGDGWWRRYNDPQLNALVDEALKGSPTLVQAEARVRKARALSEQSRAALLPQLSANAQVAENRQSYNMGIPPEFVPKGYNDIGRGTVNLDWNLDLFGRNRAGLAAATSEAVAAQMDLAESRLMLTTSVVSAYADLARLFGEREAAAQSLANRQNTAKLVAQRVKGGSSNEGEARQAEANAASAQQQLTSLDEQIGLARNQLAALTGRGPDRGLAIARPAATIPAGYALPTDVAVDLVGRRPDVQAARRRAEAAADRIKVARAGFYPNVNLAAYFGREALGLDLLRFPTSQIGQVGAALSLPIFSAGRLEGEYRGVRADYDAAVAAYDQTLVQALQEVADAAVSARLLQTRLDQAHAALSAAEDAYRIAGLRYQAGLTNYLSVLTTEDALIIQRRTVADLEARTLTVDAALARALGGGFHTS